MAEARVVDRFGEDPCGLLVGVETHGVLGSHEVQPPLGPTVERPRTSKSILEQDVADAKKLGVRKTPAFFVNGRLLRPFGLPQLQALVASQVAANY